ncbi:MAG TPA: universal stress protein [Thermomicrobiales bacterium]
MFARILVAVDADEIAGPVLETAAGLAKPLGAKLALLHVVDVAGAIAPLAASSEPGGLGVPAIVGAANMQVTEQIIEDRQQASETFLQKLAGQLPAGVAAEVLMREGAPAEAIVAVAGEWQANLIILGTHGRSGLERLVVGSTAEAVIRAARCPVLSVRTGVNPA